MKKTIISLLFLSLLLVWPSAVPAQEGLTIITLNFPAYDFSRQVAGDRGLVSMLLPPGTDMHSFEPSPKDLIALSNADLLVYNGGVADYWVEGLLASMGDDAPAAIAMMDLVETVAEEIIEGMEDVSHDHKAATDSHSHDDHSHGEHDSEDVGELDEHVWTSPRNAILISRAIANKLTELDPHGAQIYASNFEQFESALLALDADFRALVENALRRTIVLGDRFAMRYFTREYGLSYYAAFPGCSAQTEPSAKTIAFLMDIIKKENIPVVFHIELSSRKAASLIAAETGAQDLLLHSAHNISQDDFDKGITYIDIMRGNLENLRKALY